MNPRKHPDKRLSLFNDPLQRQRYACSLVMILLMIGVAEILQEKEIIFPEMAALTIGMWIVDKRVWRIKTGQMLLLMTLGACTGVLLVLYSPFPLVVNIAIAFLFAGNKSFVHPGLIIPDDICLCASCVVKNRKLGLSGICFRDDLDYPCHSALDGTSRPTGKNHL